MDIYFRYHRQHSHALYVNLKQANGTSFVVTEKKNLQGPRTRRISNFRRIRKCCARDAVSSAQSMYDIIHAFIFHMGTDWGSREGSRKIEKWNGYLIHPRKGDSRDLPVDSTYAGLKMEIMTAAVVLQPFAIHCAFEIFSWMRFQPRDQWDFFNLTKKTLN